MTAFRNTLLLPLALAVTACSSSTLHRPNRESLTAALGDLSAENFEGAADRMEALLTSTASEAGTYGLQRFFAAYLLSRAHELAAYEGPFLHDQQASSGFQLQAGRAGSGGSHVGHLVALAFHANAGRTLYTTVRDASAQIEGEPLLPEELSELGPHNALVHLNLSLLAVYSRLNFEERSNQILSGMPEILDVETALATLDETLIDPAVRPWIFKAVFDYTRSRDEPLAYKFGILARSHADDARGSFTATVSDRIARWITEESNYDFRSPAGQLFDPALPACTVSGTPNIDFEAERKEN